MRPGWTGGATRARLLLSRTLGGEQARAIAARPSLDAAVSALAGSAYGERLHPGAGAVGAQRALAETLLWQLRVLAGWLPPSGGTLMRALTAWFELQNVDARLAALEGDRREPAPYVLGALATAWPELAPARTVEELVSRIARSRWGDVGGRTPAEIALGLRVQWARWVHEAAPSARDWVAGAGALLVARELFVAGDRDHVAQLRRLPGIGETALRAAAIEELGGALSPGAAWALAGVRGPEELWRAELGWWSRVEREAIALLRRPGDEAVVLAAVARLAADAQRIARGLEAAAAGGAPEAAELFDAAA